MEEKTAERLTSALEAIAIIQGVDFLQQHHSAASNKEKIALLDRFGFDVEKIARMAGTTVGTVKKELSLMKTAGAKNE